VKYCLKIILEGFNKIMKTVSKQLIALAQISIGYLRIQVRNPTAAATGSVSIKSPSKEVH
jgi:hypothetical protein